MGGGPSPFVSVEYLISPYLLLSLSLRGTLSFLQTAMYYLKMETGPEKFTTDFIMHEHERPLRTNPKDVSITGHSPAS